MGDRCYLEITMRRADLPLFAPHVDAGADDEWWDIADDVDNHPDLVTVGVYEANYAWQSARDAAAASGIPFFGTHEEGGEYGPGGFAACDGAMLDVELRHGGYMIIALDDDLKPVDPDDLAHLREYVAKLRAVKRLFKLEVPDGEPSADQQAEHPAVPAGLCPA